MNGSETKAKLTVKSFVVFDLTLETDSRMIHTAHFSSQLHYIHKHSQRYRTRENLHPKRRSSERQIHTQIFS